MSKLKFARVIMLTTKLPLHAENILSNATDSPENVGKYCLEYHPHDKSDRAEIRVKDK